MAFLHGLIAASR